MLYEIGRYAAQQPAGQTAAAPAHDNEVDILLLGEAAQLFFTQERVMGDFDRCARNSAVIVGALQFVQRVLTRMGWAA